MTENEKDILLLRDDPHALLLKYQRRIRIMVVQFIRSGMFNPEDEEDIVQDVTEQLLQRIPTIRRKYDRTSLLVTYFSTVVHHICLRLHKDSKVQYESSGAADFVDTSTNQVFSQVAIGQAVTALREVIELYHRDKPRLIFLLRLYFRIALDEETVLRAYPGCPPELLREILESLGANIAEKEERELLALAAPFLGVMEGRTISVDGYRHWLGRAVREILLLLRARLGIPGFSADALGQLFELMMLRSEDEK